jgi:ubiquinone/menaquinone biosynthesis C-methylase UbiE
LQVLGSLQCRNAGGTFTDGQGTCPEEIMNKPRAAYEPIAIQALFEEMAATYGVVNYISSFGFAARWRHQVIENISLTENSHVVDLMSGMNELCRSLSLCAPQTLHLTARDISPEMIRRARKDWPFEVGTHLQDVFTWDFEPACADAVICSFGLKTLDRNQQMELARRVASLLRSGGMFSFIEISVPSYRPLQWGYMLYLEHIIPWIGRIFLGNPANHCCENLEN